MAQIEGLQVNLQGNADGLNKSINEAKTNLAGLAQEAKKLGATTSNEMNKAANNVGGSFSRLGSNIGSAFAGLARTATLSVAASLAAVSGGALVAAASVKKIADEADELGKASQKIGIAVETLSQLKYTADLSGMSMQGLQSGVTRLTKSMSEIAKGSENDASKAFEALGISAKNADGSLRSANDVMADIANKFVGFRDGAEKTALAIAIFGRAGADMIPFLNQGAEAINKASAEARDFGVVLSGSVAKASENLNDNMSRIQYAFKGVYVAIANELIPIFSEWSDKLVESVKEMQLFERTGQLMRSIINAITEAVIWASGRLEGFNSIIESIGRATVNIASGEFGKAWDTLKNGADRYSAAIENSSSKIDEFRKKNEQLSAFGTLGTAMGAFPDQRKAAPTLAGTGGGGGAAAQDPLAQQREQILQRLGMIKEGFLSERELLIQKYEEDQNVIDMYYQMQLEKFSGNKEMERQLAEEHNTLMQQLEAEHQKKLSQIRDTGFNDALTSTAKIFNSLGRLAQSGGKKNVKLAKAFGIAEAIISTFVAANKAMAFAATAGPAAAFAAYASVAAQGLAAVAKIRSISDSGGGGGGGSSAGAGGDGGGAAASNAAGGGGQPGGNSVYINLQGQSFGRDQVRDLVKQIADFQKDGGQVVFA